MRVARWAAAALLLAACAPAPKPESPQEQTARLRAESDSARKDIEATNARFARLIGAGQADSAAAVYADDAVFYMAGMQPTQGRAAIAAAFKGMLASGTWNLALMTVKVEASGPLAVETGRIIITVTPGPNSPPAMRTPTTDTLAYVTSWRKTDGKWLLVDDISVSTKAPPAALPTRRR